MAPRTLARSRIRGNSAWAHPSWYGMGVFYADGGDAGAAADADDRDAGGDGDGEPADDWTPPSRAEYEKLMADKKKADGEAASRRKYLRAHGIDPKTGEKAKADESDQPNPAADQTQAATGVSAADMKRAIDKASAEAELRGRRQSRALVTGVNGALAEAGWNGQRLNSLMKLIDLDDVEIEDDGSVVGLSEQIDSIKSEWPEFFKRARNSATSSNGAGGSGQNGVAGAKVDAADKKPPAPEPKGWAEKVAEKALRG